VSAIPKKRARWIVVCLALATTAACVVDIGAPNRVPRIGIISDISRTDTINAGPSKPIVIEISDSTGSQQNAVAVNIAGTQTPTPEGDFGMFVMDRPWIGSLRKAARVCMSQTRKALV